MRSFVRSFAIAVMAYGTTVNAAEVFFLTDPFDGSTAPSTPGRQIVAGEPSITFNVATDVFVFNPAIFGISSLNFLNDEAPNIPGSGVNLVVLETFTPTPFGAGNAANLIAAQITTPGPGFFIYFNSVLDLPRLVFSPNLDDNTSDLKILARMTNLKGNSAALAGFTSVNFQLTPEPSSVLLMTLAASGLALHLLRLRSRS